MAAQGVGDQTPIAPAQVLAAAVAAGPLTPVELARFRSQLADVKASDAARRAPSPQMELAA